MRILAGIVGALILVGIAGVSVPAVWAQHPAIAVHTGTLPTLSKAACVERGRRALLAAGAEPGPSSGDYLGGVRAGVAAGRFSNVPDQLVSLACHDYDGTTAYYVMVTSLDGEANNRVRDCLAGFMRSESPAQCVGLVDPTGGGGTAGASCTWTVQEVGWTTTWSPIGGNRYRVTGRRGANSLTAEQTVEVSGDRVTVERDRSSDGNACRFEGAIQADGVRVTGTYRCDSGGPYSWSATISCGGAPDSLDLNGLWLWRSSCPSGIYRGTRTLSRDAGGTYSGTDSQPGFGGTIEIRNGRLSGRTLTLQRRFSVAGRRHEQTWSGEVRRVLAEATGQGWSGLEVRGTVTGNESCGFVMTKSDLGGGGGGAGNPGGSGRPEPDRGLRDRYVRHPDQAIGGANLRIVADVGLDECLAECEADSACLAAEYLPHYRECRPQGRATGMVPMVGYEIWVKVVE